MEKLLHYVWKHKLFPPEGLATTDGRRVEVVDAGLHNSNAGPDFFNAKVRIGGTLWVGNVEIHECSHDWYVHHHDTDAAYDNVVLHVVSAVDCDVATRSGNPVPQVRLLVPATVQGNYDALLQADRYPPCRATAAALPRLVLHSWLSALQAERLAAKADAIVRRVAEAGGSWEDACFATLARAFGFGVNADTFELWARSIPLMSVAHHRDDAFQVEALFMGQAGLLQPDVIPLRHRAAALADDYYLRLCREYAYLAHKFALAPIDGHLWRFLRLRPQNFPHIRIAQLAALYCSRRASLRQLIECAALPEARAALATAATPYWRTHYGFGVESAESDKRLTAASIDTVVINAVVPMLYAYGRHKNDDALCLRAMNFLESLRPEANGIVRRWRECGVEAQNAADSQALIQLQHAYCDRKDCLRCRIGYEFLRGKG